MIRTFADLQIHAKKIVSKKQLESIIRNLAISIDSRFQYATLEVVVLMNGAYQLVADLSKLLTVPTILNFQKISRYEDDVPSKDLITSSIPLISTDNRPVLVIDDVFDEGITLEHVVNTIRAEHPNRDVFSLVLFSKVKSREIKFIPNFVGLNIDDVYIFGYGMDLSQNWRHLPEVWMVTDGSTTH